MIDVPAQITLWEQFRALRAVRRRSVGVWVGTVVFVALLLLVIAMPAFFGEDVVGNLRRQAPFLAFLLVLAALIPVVQLWSIWRFRRQTPSARGIQNYRIDSSGVELSGDLARTKLEWPAFVRIVETRDFFLFYIAKNRAYFLPKRVLTFEQLGELRRDLPAWIGSKVTLRSP